MKSDEKRNDVFKILKFSLDLREISSRNSKTSIFFSILENAVQNKITQ